MHYYSTLNFEILATLVFQLELYYKLDRPLTGFTVQQIEKTAQCYYTHASALRAATEIQPIEFKNQQAVPIRSHFIFDQ